MSSILKLLGVKYTMQLNYSPYLGEYIVKIRDRDGNKAERSFSALEAETADFDMLVSIVEQCIFRLRSRNETGEIL